MSDFSVSELSVGTLTVSLPACSGDRLDEVADILERMLRSEGVGRFAWHQEGRHHPELVFHVFGERASLLVRGELDRLGYDRRALVMTDYGCVHPA